MMKNLFFGYRLNYFCIVVWIVISLSFCGCGVSNENVNIKEVDSTNECREYSVDDIAVLKSELFFDETTQVPIRRYYFDDANIHGGYVNNSLYINDDTFFFISDCNGSANIYLVEILNESVHPVTDTINQDLYEDVNSFGLTPCIAGDDMFYSLDNDIYKFNYETKKTEQVIDSTAVWGGEIWAPLHVTNDGKWLSTTVTNGDICYITRLNIETKEIDYLKSPFVGTEQATANHACINPQNPDLIMFAHDGSWIMDRVWFWKLNNQNDAYNLFEHPEYTEMGHEVWNKDGTHVVIVQYGSPSRCIGSGFNILNLEGEYVEQIEAPSGYYFSHVAVSPDEKFLVADTFRPDEEDKRWIVLYSMEDETFTKLASYESDNHPAHAHPFFSKSGNKIMYNNLVDGKIELNEIDLRDIDLK